MRLTATFSALLMLAACATAASTTPAPSTTPSAPVVAPSRVALLLAAAGSASAPTQAEVERALGPADISRQDGAGAALTYRLESCALLLLFAADARNALRLSEAHPSARRAGEAAPTLQQCAAEADARRS